MLVIMEACIHLCFMSSFLLQSLGCIQGIITVYPSGIASVCSGDQLELTCNVTRSVLEWRINVTSASSYRIYRRGVISEGQTFTQTYQLMINNSILLTFSRISNEGDLPLVSRLLINPVCESLNGTKVICEADPNQMSSNLLQSTTTTITIIRESMAAIADKSLLNLTKQLNYESDGVTVTLEWAKLSSLSTYYVSVIPPTPFMFNGSTELSVVFNNMSYNTMYNVSVLVETPCGRKNMTLFSDLYYYSNCGTPSLLPNQCHIISYANMLEGTKLTILCRMLLQIENQSVCAEVTVVAVCDKEGICKLRSDETYLKPPSGMEPSPQTLSIVLGSVFGIIVCLIIITVAGFLLVTLFIKAKFKGSNRSNELEKECKSVNTGVELYDAESKTGTSVLVYAEVDQSLFNQQSHLKNSIHTFDDSTIEYAKIKHTNKSSVSVLQNMRSQMKEELIEGVDESLDKHAVNLDNLLIQLKPQVACRWYEFGEAVGIEKEVLDKFDEQCSPEDCIVETLDLWLRQCNKQPTWSDVAKILKIINLPKLALDIESVYKTGKLPVEVEMEIPQLQENLDSESVESPPPIPPKMSENTTLPPMSQRLDPSIPALPPKPVLINNNNMCGTIPPRPPK